MWQVYGQDHILRHMEASLKQGRAAHAYLLVGPPHVGKMTLALNLAQGVNCMEGPGEPCGDCVQCTRIARGHHADLRIVGLGRSEEGEPARTVIGIGDVREVLRQVNLKPYEGACTVIIFDRAELMSEDAANALLKTLEEPPPQVLILLLSADAEGILPTVRSRCRRLVLLPVPKAKMVETLVREHHASPEEAERLSRLARGCPGWAITALAEGEEVLDRREAEMDRLTETCASGLNARFNYAGEIATLFSRDRDSAKQQLFLWLRWWRDLLLVKEGGEEYVLNIDRQAELRLQAAQLTSVQIVRFVKRLLETLEALDRNARARLALEMLMLDLPVTTVKI
jgi:DNA polymerase-3 subunit delta'